MNNNGVGNSNIDNNVDLGTVASETPVLTNNQVPTPVVDGNETIAAAKVYKLTPENAPKEIPKTEIPAWKKSKEERKQVEETPSPPKQEYVIKTKNYLARFFFLIILCMTGYIAYSYYTNTQTVERLNNLSSPVSTMGEEKELKLDSTIVQDLYSKVKTNIREDVAQFELNDELKMYLAYRAIPIGNIYESKCDGFDDSVLIPFTCPINDSKYVPNAFKKETIEVEYKKLFGENTNFVPNNVQIGKNCIVGYQYIESRGEYVQGRCNQYFTTTYSVTKELTKAISKESTITLYEQVKYLAGDGQSLPSYLRSGEYVYVFKLDSNYNYVYVTKYLNQED